MMNNRLKSIVETLHCNVSTAMFILLLSCFHSVAYADLNTGLVAYWSFDDCTAKDNSGKGNNGTINGNPQCVAGAKGSAFKFDRDYAKFISFFNQPFGSLTGDIAISTYIKAESYTDSYNHPMMIIANEEYDYGSCSSYLYWPFRVMVDISGKPYVDATLDNRSHNMSVGADISLFDNKFHHFLFMRKGSSALIYIDGKKVAETQFSGSVDSSCANTFIGLSPYRGLSNYGSYPFNGLIDETRIYNRALTDSEVVALYKGTAAPNLDMTIASCRYVAPIYSKMWLQMKVKNPPSCGAVLRYHTWINQTRKENYNASDYYSNRLTGIDTSNQLFNARLALIDDGISILNDVLDPDLRKVLSPEGYQSSVNIMKSKGIVKSLAAGTLPFKNSTLKGKVLNKAFKDKILANQDIWGISCSLFFDGAVADSCGSETAKVVACGLGLATEGWKGVSGCVLGGITSYTGFINNVFDIGQVVDIKQHNYGYILINDYLNDYYAKGIQAIPTDDVKLESDIQNYANKLQLSSGGLFTFADFQMQFVKDCIRSSITRNAVTASANVRTFEQIRAILY